MNNVFNNSSDDNNQDIGSNLKNKVEYIEENNIFLDNNISFNDIVNQSIINKQDMGNIDANEDSFTTNVIKINFSNDNKKKKKNNWKFLDIIISNKTKMVLSILTFIFIGITVCKTFILRDKVNNYEKDYYVIEKKLSMETIIYNDIKDDGSNNKL